MKGGVACRDQPATELISPPAARRPSTPPTFLFTVKVTGTEAFWWPEGAAEAAARATTTARAVRAWRWAGAARRLWAAMRAGRAMRAAAIMLAKADGRVCIKTGLVAAVVRLRARCWWQRSGCEETVTRLGQH